MRFLADESCDFAVVHALREVGHDVVTVRDLAPGAPDEAVIRMTLDDDRTLLTEDRDFGRLVFANATLETFGVLYLRFPATARQAVADAVVKLVDREGEGLNGRFVVVQPGRIRATKRHRGKAEN